MNTIYDDTNAFAKTHIHPHTQKADEEGTFPLKSYHALQEHGYMGLLVPKAYGGQEESIETHTLCIEAIAQHCATTALAYMMHNVATMCIVLHGSQALKDELLPQIAKGKVTLALAYSETGTGTHFYQPDISVTEHKGKQVLNGRKSFVTSAEVADYYLIISNSLKEGMLDNWIVSGKQEGLSFEPQAWDGLGMRGNASMPMVLDNVTVTPNQRIGEEGSGLEQIFNVVAPYFILGLSAVYTGVALHAQALICEHTMKRTYTSNEALCQYPTVQNDLANIYLKAQSAKHFTHNAASSAANGSEDALAQIIASRVNASQISIEVCTLAMKLGGGTAYAKRLPLERLLRDSFASQVMAPGVDVLSIWLGKALTNQDIL